MSSMRARQQLFETVEAAYADRSPGDEWLRGMLETIAPTLDGGAGVVVAQVDATNVLSEAPKLIALAGVGLTDKAAYCFERLSGMPASKEAQDKFRRTGPVVDSLAAITPLYRDTLASFGFEDCVQVLAGELNGLLTLFAAPAPKARPMTRRRHSALGRIAAHVAAAQRLRGRPAPTAEDDSEEVVWSDGPTELEATSRARTRADLRRAATAIDCARGTRRDDPERALAMWTALVAGEWSLLDRFDESGRHFYIARRNPPETHNVLRLHAREAQVVSLAAQGHGNKLIAYELGIAVSTVASHLSHAMAKLGIRSRVELATVVAALSSRPSL